MGSLVMLRSEALAGLYGEACIHQPEMVAAVGKDGRDADLLGVGVVAVGEVNIQRSLGGPRARHERGTHLGTVQISTGGQTGRLGAGTDSHRGPRVTNFGEHADDDDAVKAGEDTGNVLLLSFHDRALGGLPLFGHPSRCRGTRTLPGFGLNLPIRSKSTPRTRSIWFRLREPTGSASSSGHRCAWKE
jgi:hypothetical protein